MITSNILLPALAYQMAMTGPDLATQFHSLTDKKTETEFIATYKNQSIDAQAYVLALEMKAAEYTILPWKKLNIFNSKKDELNTLIKDNPDNIHLRYIRLFLQENTPKILGYTDNIEEDKSFLIIKLKEKDSSDYLDKYITKHTSL